MCASIHYHDEVFAILRKLAHEDQLTAAEQKTLQHNVPVVFQLMASVNWEIPEYLPEILFRLIEVAKTPFSKGTCHRLPQATGQDRSPGTYFPSLPSLCERGQYILDSKIKSSEEVCKKAFTLHPSLTPGLFTLSCQHGMYWEHCPTLTNSLFYRITVIVYSAFLQLRLKCHAAHLLLQFRRLIFSYYNRHR